MGIKTIRYISFAMLSLCFILSGCVVRTYRQARDRVDQDLNIGNRGFIAGEVPKEEPKDRKTTRTTQIVEVELHSRIKFENAPKEEPTPKEKTQDKEIWGNRGYIEGGTGKEQEQVVVKEANIEKYTVKKSDTLQKISKKYFGTSKKWTKIYDANKDVLKGPNKIYPGQVLNIPVEGMKEPRENLK